MLFAIGLALLALATGAWGMAAGWVVVGIAMAFGLYDVAFSKLAVLFGRGARGPITGITLIAGFASTIGWPLTAWIEDALGLARGVPDLGWSSHCSWPFRLCQPAAVKGFCIAQSA